MYCSSCGNKINERSKFCPKCGTKNEMNKNENDYVKKVKKNSNKAYDDSNVSLIIGIAAIVLSFLLGFMTIPMSIVGIVFGFKIKQNRSKKIASLIVNFLSLIISLGVTFILGSAIVLALMKLMNAYNIYGTWSCTNYYDSTNLMQLNLSRIETFTWDTFYNQDHYVYRGQYEFNKDDKTKNYKLTLKASSVNINDKEKYEKNYLIYQVIFEDNKMYLGSTSGSVFICSKIQNE